MSSKISPLKCPRKDLFIFYLLFTHLGLHTVYLPHIKLSLYYFKKKEKVEVLRAQWVWRLLKMGMFISSVILTAALNLRWHKACKKELSVSFIISKKVPLEREEWPCSAELTYATELMAGLCCREACRNITTPMAEFAANINQGNQDDVSNTHLKVIKTNSLSGPLPQVS